jgi:hypothetical protein
MAYGLLGNCKPSSSTTEVLIYTAPSNKKAVGSLTILNTGSSDLRSSVIYISTEATGTISGSYLAATGGVTDGVTLSLFNALIKATPADAGVPFVLKGIVVGPGDSLVAYNNSGDLLHYVFNGLEENS